MNEFAVVSMKSIYKGNAMAIVTMGRSHPHPSSFHTLIKYFSQSSKCVILLAVFLYSVGVHSVFVNENKIYLIQYTKARVQRICIVSFINAHATTKERTTN